MEPVDQRLGAVVEAIHHFESSLRPRLARLRATRTLRDSARQVIAMLTALSDADLVALDRRARESSWWYRGCDPKFVRAAVRSKDDGISRAAACVGWCSSDGYLRQAAVERLHQEIEWSLPILAIRSTDWVVEVASAAMSGIGEATNTVIVGHLPLLEQLAGRDRGARLGSWTRARIEDPSALDAIADGRTHASVAVRRTCWRLLERLSPGRVEEELGLAIGDEDVATRRWAAHRLSDISGPTRAELAGRLLDDPVGWLRAQGLAYATESLSSNTSALAKDGLDDRSAIVRAVAQQRLRSLGDDPTEIYRGLLAARESPALVVGLAESGGSAVAKEVAAWLDSEALPLRRAALIALSKADSEAAIQAAAAILDGDDPLGVTAVRVLRRQRLPLALVRPIERVAIVNAQPRVRAGAMRLLRQVRWVWLSVSLRLLHDEDEEVRQRAQENVAQWLVISANVSYGPETQDRPLIEANLEAVTNDDQRREIEFVLRTTTDPDK